MDPLSDTWLEYLRAEGVAANTIARRAAGKEVPQTEPDEADA